MGGLIARVSWTRMNVIGKKNFVIIIGICWLITACASLNSLQDIADPLESGLFDIGDS